MSALAEYRALVTSTKLYYEAHKQEIEGEEHAERAKKIQNDLTRLLPTRTVTVWCRNARFCLEATHCEDLQCDYKSDKNDTIDGPSRCQSFQLTTKSEAWGPAKHIAEQNSTDICSNRSGR